MKKYTVWVIQAYFEKRDDGTLIDSVLLEIIAENEKEAMKQAKNYIKKPFYRLAQVIEKYV